MEMISSKIVHQINEVVSLALVCFFGYLNQDVAYICQSFMKLCCYSRVHSSWNEVFSKILKKPSIVQK